MTDGQAVPAPGPGLPARAQPHHQAWQRPRWATWAGEGQPAGASRAIGLEFPITHAR